MLGRVHIPATHPRKCRMPSTTFSQIELVMLCPCVSPGLAGSEIVELQWHAAPSKEPGGPPNRRQSWYLCKLHAGAFEIHGATQPRGVEPVWHQCRATACEARPDIIIGMQSCWESAVCVCASLKLNVRHRAGCWPLCAGCRVHCVRYTLRVSDILIKLSTEL